MAKYENEKKQSNKVRQLSYFLIHQFRLKDRYFAPTFIIHFFNNK